MSNRTRLEIMAEILSFCKQPQRKTRVMLHANLGWKNHEKYLHELESNGFLQAHHSQLRCMTTQKGREFVERMERLKKLF